MTRDEALELIDRMPYITTIQARTDKIRIELYKNAVESDNPLNWISVIKSFYLRTHTQSGERLIASEEETRVAASAKEQLEAELAKALGIREEEVEDYINNYLDENR